MLTKKITIFQKYFKFFQKLPFDIFVLIKDTIGGDFTFGSFHNSADILPCSTPLIPIFRKYS